jgi:hypothetical protein
MNEGTWSAFDTHFDTGHKFYGFMDLFLGNTGASVNYMGLQDIAVKIVMKPAPKWTLKHKQVKRFTTKQSGPKYWKKTYGPDGPLNTSNTLCLIGEYLGIRISGKPLVD